VAAAADLAPISAVKAGDPAPPESSLSDGSAPDGGRVRMEDGAGAEPSLAAETPLSGEAPPVASGGGRVRSEGGAGAEPSLAAETPPSGEVEAPDGYRVRLVGRTRAELSLGPGERFTTTLVVRAVPPAVAGFRPRAPGGPPPWSRVPLSVRSGDGRLDALVAQGVADLGALLLADEGDLYCAAGSPWYLTLFGRDALWAARLGLPLGSELAAGTLRALARHQGVRHDAGTEEEPGKIPHELRPAHAPGFLPPVYYGSADATPLFVVTLAEAWRWGMPATEVEALLPAAVRALEWLGSFTGFVSYHGSPGKLVHQGWKDSADAVRYADGTPAPRPIALAEVQAYSYQAATLGADLLDAFGRPGGDAWRRWAARLAGEFRARFWVDGYPAIAVDADGRAVDGLASNAGHLLGTGLLDHAEEARVAARLAELDSGRGLRTLTATAAAYDPVSYHRGSVWPHDTAIAMLGLARSGHREAAARLARGLIGTAPAFAYRLPELFGGQDATTPPVPYPPACRPQAWSAAVSPALVTALFGLEPDVPNGRLTLSPCGYALTADAVRIGGATLSLRAGPDGSVTVSGAGPDLAVVVG
jgi:glycogen debranching enzyme